MIEFMIVALPRSGTTWAANWLTTGALHCIHDPLRLAHYADWDAELSCGGKRTGLACTGAWNWPEWLNAHPARKVILHRPLDEVTASLARIGLPGDAPLKGAPKLDEIEGLHVQWTDLFDAAGAAAIWAHLTGLPFDGLRHAALREMNVQPRFDDLTIRPEATRKLVADIRAMMGA
jgi:hypothetical protein